MKTLCFVALIFLSTWPLSFTAFADPFLPSNFDLSPYDRQVHEQADRLRSSSSSDARAGAAEALGFLRAYSAEGDLIAALQDKSAVARREAAIALAWCGRCCRASD